jgi:hypothetical protein
VAKAIGNVRLFGTFLLATEKPLLSSDFDETIIEKREVDIRLPFWRLSVAWRRTDNVHCRFSYRIIYSSLLLSSEE